MNKKGQSCEEIFSFVYGNDLQTFIFFQCLRTLICYNIISKTLNAVKFNRSFKKKSVFSFSLHDVGIESNQRIQ